MVSNQLSGAFTTAMIMVLCSSFSQFYKVTFAASLQRQATRSLTRCLPPPGRHQERGRLSWGQPVTRIRFGSSTQCFSFSSGDESIPEPMRNLYQEWTLEQDQILYENRRESIHNLASLLGRGLKGVESRLAKLTDINSPAYERLFSKNVVKDNDDEREERLVPAKDVLARIQWDDSLTESDFSILHYDRVQDEILESPMDAPNTSVAGKERQLVLALPEHRIVAIKYKDRIVWDRQKRIDRVFGSTGSNGETIDVVLKSYDAWKMQREAADEWSRKRQAEVANRIQRVLGLSRFSQLKDMSSNLLHFSSSENDMISIKSEADAYVQAALKLFRDVRQDSVSSLEPSSIPHTDVDALDMFSELVALLPNEQLRPVILVQISWILNRLEGKTGSSVDKYVLPDLNEDELSETFVRGSGPGGQKVNKTSNRVVLVHVPTQVRVECQETRSLQQNRKIARQRLRLKLDEFLNGNDSKTSLQAFKAASKKSKAKTRNKARQRKKKELTAADDHDASTM